jgi:hypothetical protein
MSGQEASEGFDDYAGEEVECGIGDGVGISRADKRCCQKRLRELNGFVVKVSDRQVQLGMMEGHRGCSFDARRTRGPHFPASGSVRLYGRRASSLFHIQYWFFDDAPSHWVGACTMAAEREVGSMGAEDYWLSEASHGS